MSTNKDTTLVGEAAVLLKKNAPIPPELRQRILMLPPAARRDAGLRLADLAAKLIQDGADKYQGAIAGIADMLTRIDGSLRAASASIDGFQRTR